ncbi:hypothetical protein PQX77_015250 [Marasmius sp. AFHP31]|nr:hypothetical protein PQX77_015250 [Marasmius sp. AFHP31]
MPEYTSRTRPTVNNDVWDTDCIDGKWRVFCKRCNDRDLMPQGRNPYLTSQHEGTMTHRSRTAHDREPNPAETLLDETSESVYSAVPIRDKFDYAATKLLQSFMPASKPCEILPEFTDIDYPPLEQLTSPWPNMNDLDDHFEQSENGCAISLLLEGVAEMMENGPMEGMEFGPDDVDSDDEGCDMAEEWLEDDMDETTHLESIFLGSATKKRRVQVDELHEWFPWDSRLTCTLDIMMHLPRSVFSTRQMDLFLWLLRINGVRDVPSTKTMKELNSNLQKLFGIQTYKYKGAFGHIYFVNSFADIIAQEMSNPNVRPNLSFYPEKSEAYLGESRQAERWLKEMDDDELTPMVRLGRGDSAQDFYIFEPALLRDGRLWMPHRWYQKKKGSHMVFVGRCWELVPVLKDGQRSWRVLTNNEGEFEQDEFLLTFPELIGNEHHYGLPSPVTRIQEVRLPNGEITPWSLTEPTKGNRWRELAKGHRVLSFLIWLYCDDTLGNTSKRWNEHNSFLFTAAGLNRTQVSKEYNIHFLCTSNTAPPLEMMDGVVDQIQDGQSHGIWAWDGETDEPVLLLPSVLALLGDNPMQSEFACHIGLRGKMFCRGCKVKGKDSKAAQGAGDGEDSGCESESDDGSIAASETGGGKKRKKFVESLDAMKRRVMDFIKPGDPCIREETVQQLKEHFQMAQNLGTSMKMKQEQTRTGLKDTYQMFFVNRLLNSYKGQRTLATKTTALNQAKSALPKQTMSPVWRIRGLNPHSDTPVEILHIVLLGFVKYLWRDVIQNQIKKKEDKMAELSAHLSSVNVDGLGLPSFLAGDTLTKFYGSLTGGDFRKLAQVAPFVLHGLVSEDCYETWVVLSKLIPLIWQPEILDLPLYLAPSRDIAYAFAQGNRLRHILSGGKVLLRQVVPWSEDIDSVRKDFDNADLPQSRRVTDVQLYFRNFTITKRGPRRNDHDFAVDSEHWVTAGHRPREVIEQSQEPVGRYLGLPGKLDRNHNGPGRCDFDSDFLPFTNTRHSQHACDLQRLSEDKRTTGVKNLRIAGRIELPNGDKVVMGSYVIVRLASPDSAARRLSVANIVEVLHHREGSSTILVRLFTTSTEASSHGMPRLQAQDVYHSMDLEDVLCSERHDTGLRRGQVEHQGNPSDIVLNTAQMRDAKFLQSFRITPPSLPVEDTIRESAAREHTILQKAGQNASLVIGEPLSLPASPQLEPSSPHEPGSPRTPHILPPTVPRVPSTPPARSTLLAYSPQPIPPVARQPTPEPTPHFRQFEPSQPVPHGYSTLSRNPHLESGRHLAIGNTHLASILSIGRWRRVMVQHLLDYYTQVITLIIQHRPLPTME